MPVPGRAGRGETSRQLARSMSVDKPFLLRLDPETFAALQAWAADDLRSVNGQVEFLLRRALRDAGRLPWTPCRRSKRRERSAGRRRATTRATEA